MKNLENTLRSSPTRIILLIMPGDRLPGGKIRIIAGKPDGRYAPKDNATGLKRQNWYMILNMK